MDISKILQELKAERNRVEQALAALEGRGSGRRSRTTRRPASRRRLSAAARRPISQIGKRRWKGRTFSLGPTLPEEGRPPRGRPKRFP